MSLIGKTYFVQVEIIEYKVFLVLLAILAASESKIKWLTIWAQWLENESTKPFGNEIYRETTSLDDKFVRMAILAGLYCVETPKIWRKLFREWYQVYLLGLSRVVVGMKWKADICFVLWKTINKRVKDPILIEYISNLEQA